MGTNFRPSLRAAQNRIAHSTEFQMKVERVSCCLTPFETRNRATRPEAGTSSECVQTPWLELEVLDYWEGRSEYRLGAGWCSEITAVACGSLLKPEESRVLRSLGGSGAESPSSSESCRDTGFAILERFRYCLLWWYSDGGVVCLVDGSGQVEALPGNVRAMAKL